MLGKRDQGALLEYAVYTYDRPLRKGGHGRWRRHDIKTDFADALGAAKKFFRTGDYVRVEIKRKFFDGRQNRYSDVTLKVFEAGSRRTASLALSLLFAATCAAAAYVVTVLLGAGY